MTISQEKTDFTIAQFDGDGIGPEIMAPCIEVVERAKRKTSNRSLRFESVAAGAGHFEKTGESLPKASMETARNSDAILLSAMGLPHIRYPDGTEISPQIELRMELGLIAGVRPIRLVPGIPTPLADPRAREIDLVIIRESTEGLFASHGKGEVIDDREARDTLVITREVSEWLFDFSLNLAKDRKRRGRPGLVTCVDKANVFSSFAFMRKIFDERAAQSPDIATDHMYIDATALNLVKRPWDFDVLVTENMFGDILSDLGAGLIGGMGMAPSADIGPAHAVFQPCHGSAPDIAGKGLANPAAMFLSGAMMLDWLGARHDADDLRAAADLLSRAVDDAFRSGKLQSTEMGGHDGTDAITSAVIDALDTLAKDHS